MGRKLVGLLRSSTGITHGLKDENTRTGYCGFKDRSDKPIPYSGRTNVTCQKCSAKLPENII